MANRDRLRLIDFSIDPVAEDQCEIQVALGWDTEEEFVGTNRGPDTRVGSCRCAALATLQALEYAAQNRVELELVGVRVVRAFDSAVVIVCVVSHSKDHVLPFLGACLVKEADVARYAALATLDATNRLLGGVLEQ